MGTAIDMDYCMIVIEKLINPMTPEAQVMPLLRDLMDSVSHPDMKKLAERIVDPELGLVTGAAGLLAPVAGDAFILVGDPNHRAARVRLPRDPGAVVVGAAILVMPVGVVAASVEAPQLRPAQRRCRGRGRAAEQ